MNPKPKTRKQYKGTNYAGYLRGWNMVDARIRKQKRSAPSS